MKKRVVIYILSFTMGVLFSKCSTMSMLINEEEKFRPTDPKNITITTQNKVDKANKEIGYVSSSKMEIGFFSSTKTNIDGIKEKLKNEAAEMGGDAIIDFKTTAARVYIWISYIPLPFDKYICRGRVIKYY